MGRDGREILVLVTGCGSSSLIPEFSSNSLIVVAFHDKYLIHLVLEYVTGIGNVDSSLCRARGNAGRSWLGQGSTVQRHKEQTVGRRPRVSTFATEAAERVFHESAETRFKHPQDRLVSYRSINRIILA